MVGVVIPVRDGAAFVGEAVRSVAAQRVAHHLVVVDDGSTDDSANVARAAGGAAMTLVRTGGVGPGPARNAGVAALPDCTAIAFLDADDAWTPDRLTTGLAALGTDPAPALCFGRQVVMGEPDGPAEVACLPQTLVMTTATWQAVGPFTGAVRIGEFLDWLMRARDLGVREVVHDDVVLRRRPHADNLTADPQELRSYARVLKAGLERRRAAAREAQR